MRILVVFAYSSSMNQGMGGAFKAIAEWGCRSEEDLDVFVREEIKRVKKELSRFKESFNRGLDFVGWNLVRGEEDVLRMSSKVQDSDVTAVLVYMFTSHLYSHTFLTFNKPLIFFTKEYLGKFYGYNVRTYFSWRLAKIGREQWVSVIWDDYNRLEWELRALYAISKLRNTRIVFIGKPASWTGLLSWGYASYEFLREMEDVFGVRVSFLPLEEFVQEFKKLRISPEAREIYRDFLKSAAKVDKGIDESSALKAVSMYLFLQKIVKEEKAGAIAINCYESDLINETKTTPCFALSRLNDEGTVSACEGDPNALLGMLIGSFIADRPVFMGDPVLNPTVDRVINAHCTCPTKLRGYASSPVPYIATTHYESGKGLTPQVVMDEGEKVTTICISPNLKKVVAMGGVIIKSNMGYPICRTQVELEVDNGAKLWNVCKPFGAFVHMINFYGDYINELKSFCRNFGVQFLPDATL